MHLKKSVPLSLFLAVLPVHLAGQAMVEHAVISGATATAAASAKGAAGSISGALKKLDGTFDKASDKAAKKPASATVTATASVAALQPAAPAKPAKIYEDPKEIKTGLTDVELLRRFGDPAMRITGDGGDETFYYSQKGGLETAQVRVSGGRVVAVDLPTQAPAAK